MSFAHTPCVDIPRSAARHINLTFFNLRSCSIYQASLSVADICKTFGASWVTLERAFNEEFGVAPKVYAQSQRLTAVRQPLIKSDPGTLIADAGNRWGFWHMGLFAVDYRRDFGELPSQFLQSR
jgi:AraC-like DNA-binding protein